MTDVTENPGSSPENPIDNSTPWVKAQIDEYLATDGAEPTFRYGSPLLLLTTKGRKSGEWRRTCLIHGEDDGRQIIVASLGGAPKHPIWYLNLEAHPEVYLQVKGESFAGIARTATAEEKPALWQKMVDIYPDYADYQEKTDREIPIVVIDRA
ncbi:nitroreductase family deazaflavin-dependent oxidoreductase [soil metagenome]